MTIYIIKVANHFVKIKTPAIEYVLGEEEASRFETVLEAAEAAESHRVSGYQVIPCRP